MRQDEHVSQKVTFLFEKYADTVKRICFMYMKNDADSDDILQEVFLKLVQHNKPFRSDEHERAWLIRAAINRCKNLHKSFWRKNTDSLDVVTIESAAEIEIKNNEMLKLVLSLPPKYKDVIYLFYYEGYTVPQMAKVLSKNENTIYSNLHRARLLLKEKIEKIGGDVSEYLS